MIYEKLFKIQGLVVKKDAENPFYNSKYTTLDQLVKELTPILTKNNLVITHYTENREMCTKLIDLENLQKDGTYESIVSRFPLVETNDPQKYGSCITYAKRYNLGQIFNIITDEDDDANTFVKKQGCLIPSEKDLNKVGLTTPVERCKTCGGRMKISKAGKQYCENLCWKNKKKY